MPQPPQGLFELLENEDMPMEEIEKYNKTAFNSYNFTALVPCKVSYLFSPARALELLNYYLIF